MPTSPARAAAFDILLRVERADAYASELLHASRYAKLLPADHALATELVMGVLRWRSLLDGEIAHFSTQKLEKLDVEVLTALRMAAYQLFFLDRIPARAAVHESVELVKRARKHSAAPLVNAVLRKLSNAGITKAVGGGSRGRGAKSAAAIARAWAHPPWLVERWSREYGVDAAGRICRSDQSVAATSVRLPDSSAQAEVTAEGVELGPGALLASAHRVRSGDITRTRAFAEGRIAIQDEASQLVALLVGRGANILDCCAAPGGKTAILAERNPEATIVAADLHPHRARLLRKLVRAEGVRVVAADARQLPVRAQFDRVLADVPCSGTGTLARHPEIKWRLKPEDLSDLQRRQLAILQSAMAHLTPGGRLVYATCSLEPEENTGVIEKTLSENQSFRLVDCRQELERLRAEGELIWNELDCLISGPYLRTLPGVHPCDGFFAAILEKSQK